MSSHVMGEEAGQDSQQAEAGMGTKTEVAWQRFHRAELGLLYREFQMKSTAKECVAA